MSMDLKKDELAECLGWRLDFEVKSQNKLLLGLLRDLEAELQIESQSLCFRENPIYNTQWKEKKMNAKYRGNKRKKLVKIEVKIWKSRITRWIKENWADITYLYARRKSEEVQNCSCVVVSSELELYIGVGGSAGDSSTVSG